MAQTLESPAGVHDLRAKAKACGQREFVAAGDVGCFGPGEVGPVRVPRERGLSAPAQVLTVPQAKCLATLAKAPYGHRCFMGGGGRVHVMNSCRALVRKGLAMEFLNVYFVITEAGRAAAAASSTTTLPGPPNSGRSSR